MHQKILKMNRNGMILIPEILRKKHNWKEGSEFTVIEMDGHFEIIPILELNQLPKMTPTELAEIYDKSNAADLEIEK